MIQEITELREENINQKKVIDDLSEKLVNAQQQLINEVEKTRFQESEKFKKQISELQISLDKSKEIKDYEIEMKVVQELQKYEKVPQIIECCNEIEKDLGTLSAKLISLCNGYDTLDFISKEKIFGLSNYIKTIIRNIEELL